MDTIVEMFTRGAEQLLGRAGGPLHFRLFIMPLVVSFFAIRAGMKDARQEQPSRPQTILSHPAQLRGRFQSALKDVGKIFIVAVALDTTYQLVVLRAFYPAQMLIIAVGCALLPYLLIRTPVSCLMRRIYRKHPQPANPPAAKPKD